jgi:hypothetical protein
MPHNLTTLNALPLEVESDYGEMLLILTFTFKSEEELQRFLNYRKDYELADFKNFHHTNAHSEFKTWIETKIQAAGKDDEFFDSGWEIRYGGEETHEKTFQHKVFYDIEPYLDGGFLHYDKGEDEKMKSKLDTHIRTSSYSNHLA